MATNYNTIADEHPPGLRTFADGKEDGPVIVFVHGWPDDHALWDKQVRLMMFVCLCVCWFDVCEMHDVGGAER